MRIGRLLVAIAVVCLTTSVVFTGCGKKDSDSGDTGDLSQGVFSGRASAADSVVVEYRADDSATVFDLLIKDHQVDYQFYGSNVFILAVDSVRQGNNHVWLFSVNDTMTRVSANQMRVGQGDHIRWFFRDITK